MCSESTRVALVTGATRSMGIAIARSLFHDGFSVMGCGRSIQDGVAAAASIDSSGYRARFVTCDVTDATQVDAAIKATIEAFGRLDVVVNNAAAIEHVRRGHDLPVADMDVSVLDNMLQVGVIGPFLLAKAAIPHMLARGSGVFVHVTSVAAVRALPGLTGYGPSKAALEALSNQIAVDYGSAGIRSNCVRAGTIRVSGNHGLLDDPQAGALLRRSQMIGRNGLPQDVAAAVSYLASEKASFVTGSVLSVDGGSVTKQDSRAADFYSDTARS
jgi:NAD(P)-dependent dehydrogenase (short-subunit alcohol dehydrogenase family)